MENITSDIDSLIAGFFTNSLSEDDKKKLINWLDEDATHQNEFNRLRSSWIMAGYESGKKDFDPWQGWLSIGQRIKPQKAWWNRRFAPWGYAASLLLCVALGATIAIHMPHSEQVTPLTPATATTIYVPMGAKSNVVLPDGSTVWLNAGSEIHYLSDFGQENRDLQLTGEAFFEVKSDSLKPFNVHTSGMIVKALGTRFNVKAYPNDDTMVATLEEGIVDVVIQTSINGISSSKSINLKPKEQMVIQKTELSTPTATSTPDHVQETAQETVLPQTSIKEVIITSNVRTELSTSWKDKKWIISDEPLALFAENLERRYNLRIHFTSEELKEYNFSGTFENETVEQILTALSLAAPINYKLDKNNVVLSLNQKDKDKFIKILKTKI